MRACLFLICGFCVSGASLLGQVVLDGTLGISGPLSGPHFDVPAHVGQRLGANLFHSFSQFNLQTGQSATFSGPSAVRNVLARVTGGEASSIDGTLRATIPGANLYLLNAAGVLFGPNASVDVSGSFIVSTADYVKLAEDGRFDVSQPENSLLTASPPAAFGFLDPLPAAVTLENTHVAVGAEQSIAIAAGDIHLTGSSLTAPGGGINLVSAGSAGEVIGDLAQRRADPQLEGFARGGAVELRRASTLNVSGEKAGRVVIRGGRLVMEGIPFAGQSAVKVVASQPDAGGGVDVRVSESASLNFNAEILARNTGGVEGQPLSVTVVAGEEIRIENRSSISSQTTSHARGADVTLQTKDLRVAYDSSVKSYAERDGAAGALHVTADSIDLYYGAELRTETEKNSLARGGAIDIATKTLSLRDDSQILSITAGEGPGGNITIGAEDITVQGVVSGSQVYNESRIQSSSGFRPLSYNDSVTRGDGGDISITARSLHLGGGGRIISTSYQNGAGGDIAVEATQIDISGAGIANAAGIETECRQWFVDNFNNQTSHGSAGNISIRTMTLEASRGGQIATRGITARGTAGDIDVTADTVTLSAITAPTLSSQPRGGILASVDNEISRGYSGGDITVKATRLDVTEGAAILAAFSAVNPSPLSLFTAGRGPAIRLYVNEVSVAGSGAEIATKLRLDRTTQAVGGDIEVLANRLSLERGGKLGTLAEGGGDSISSLSRAGDIRIHSGEFFVAGTTPTLQPSTLYAKSAGTPGNGRIQVQAGKLRVGDGGLIEIRGGFAYQPSGLTLLTEETEITRAGRIETSGTLGENLTLQASVGLTLSAGGQINAETTSYVFNPYPGAIDVTSPQIVLQGKDSRIVAQAKNEGTPPETRSLGGDINIHTGNLQVLDGASISGIASFRGDGGSIQVSGLQKGQRADSIRIAGLGSSIIADAVESGPTPRAGGDIRLLATNIELSDQAKISTSTSTPLRGGKVVVESARLTLSGRSTISSASSQSGPGGDASLTVDTLHLRGRSSISASSRQSGAAGELSIQAGSRVIVESGSSISTAAAAGTGGDIFISAGKEIRLSDSRVTAVAGGDGGNITFLAPARAEGSGFVKGRGPSEIYFFNSIVSAESSQGNGGNIVVDPQFIVLNQSRISANAQVGNGGAVDVVANYLFQSDSRITASSELGLAGEVTILAPDLDLSGSLTPLNVVLLEGESHLPAHCAKKFSGILSSFIVVGRGGLPLDPAGWQPSFD